MLYIETKIALKIDFDDVIIGFASMRVEKKITKKYFVCYSFVTARIIVKITTLSFFKNKK